MELRSLSVILLLAMLIPCGQTQGRTRQKIPKADIILQTFAGATITLKCGIKNGEGSAWTIVWYENGIRVGSSNEKSAYVYKVTADDEGKKIICRGIHKQDAQKRTEASDIVELSLSGP